MKFGAVLAALVFTATTGAPAQATAPIEAYLRPPEFMSPVLSPDATHIAVLVPAKGRMNLAAVDLATRKAVLLTGYEKYDVVSFHWVGNERLVFSLGQLETPIGESYGGGGLYSIGRDGADGRELWGVRGPGMHYVHEVPGSNDEIIAAGYFRSFDSQDLYRVNVLTGKGSLITVDRPRGQLNGWVLDADLVPRIAYTSEEGTLRAQIHYRASADAAWKVISTVELGVDGGFVPVRIEPDGRSLVVLARVGSDTAGLHRLDIDSGKIIETLAHHPRYDMTESSLIESRDGRSILGFTVEAEQRQFTWLDAGYRRAQQIIDKSLPGRVNLLQRRPAVRRTLVTSYADRQPARYYMFDEEKLALEELFEGSPWLKSEDLVEMRAFLLKTRDGLEIPSFVFVPARRKPGERLPTVVMIHGGPEVRSDVWGYHTPGAIEAQLLASRGYAVVLPNFRITPGLGRRIHVAGFGQLGRKMQDDHEDSTRWAIDEGFADPARICIYGASYGGYAALMALVKTPGLYRCGIAAHAVTDFESLIDSPVSVYSYDKSTPVYYRKLIGDPADDPDHFRAISPARQAEKIKAPVFLIVGGEDWIVPPGQTRTMRRALERAGNPPRVLMQVDEGHGFRKLEHRVDEFEQILQFLDQHIGLKGGPH